MSSEIKQRNSKRLRGMLRVAVACATPWTKTANHSLLKETSHELRNRNPAKSQEATTTSSRPNGNGASNRDAPAGARMSKRTHNAITTSHIIHTTAQAREQPTETMPRHTLQRLTHLIAGHHHPSGARRTCCDCEPLAWVRGHQASHAEQWGLGFANPARPPQSR